MNDTILRAAATLYGEAGVCGLAGLYAAAYVMACRVEAVGPWRGTWVQMLEGSGPFARLGGWSWYTLHERNGTLAGYIDEMRDDVEMARDGPPDAYRLAYYLVRLKLAPWQIRELALLETGMQLGPDPLLFCMSAQDVEINGWRDGDVVVEGPQGFALHLYAEWPGR